MGVQKPEDKSQITKGPQPSFKPYDTPKPDAKRDQGRVPPPTPTTPGGSPEAPTVSHTNDPVNTGHKAPEKPAKDDGLPKRSWA